MDAAREGRARGFENGVVQPLGRKRGRFPGRHAPSIAIGSSGESLKQVGWATFREPLPAQPVDATPSAINLFTKGGVYDATTMGEAFRDAENRHVEPLEG